MFFFFFFFLTRTEVTFRFVGRHRFLVVDDYVIYDNICDEEDRTNAERDKIITIVVRDLLS